MRIRKLAFDYAEINKILNNFNNDLRMAGEDWLIGFLKRQVNFIIEQYDINEDISEEKSDKNNTIFFKSLLNMTEYLW